MALYVSYIFMQKFIVNNKIDSRSFGREAGFVPEEALLVSREHGVLFKDGKNVYYYDISMNGSWVNGTKIQNRGSLMKEGDVVSLGGPVGSPGTWAFEYGKSIHTETR